MGNSRRVFSPEFRGEAVKSVVDTGWPVARVVRELGILEGTLGNWVNAARCDGVAGTALTRSNACGTRAP
jgi:transposase-like protein